jgi:hypothetical protein
LLPLYFTDLLTPLELFKATFPLRFDFGFLFKVRGKLRIKIRLVVIEAIDRQTDADWVSKINVSLLIGPFAPLKLIGGTEGVRDIGDVDGEGGGIDFMCELQKGDL